MQLEKEFFASHPWLRSGGNRISKPMKIQRKSSHNQGFALVVTLSLMVLLTVLALGLLSLSAVTLRSVGAGDAQATARANARLAVMLAIGELQKELGPDQRITAPASLLDSDPQTPALDGISHGHLTGVWNARDEELGEPPDYAREPSFRRWLVSNADPIPTQSLTFASSGTLTDPIDIAPGSALDPTPVRAGRIPAASGRLAWWVADENTKALSNPRDESERSGTTPVAGLLAGFGSPGAHGITALDGLADFPSNTETSDKAITHESLGLVHPQAEGGRFFHDLSPYPRSVLASVTRGGLRQDLSLYLERTDINWRQPWGKEGATGLPPGPLGPNGLLALGDPREYDTLPWKTLHHWAYAHRQQMADQNNLEAIAMLRTTPAPDPVSNPAWNSGNTRLFPVVARIQALISFKAQRIGTTNDYNLFLYTFPVVTLWNPYNVPLQVDAMHAWLLSMPLEHTVFKNGVKHNLIGGGTKNGKFIWGFVSGARNPVMAMNMTGAPQSPNIFMKPGEAKLFSYYGPWPTTPKPIRHGLKEAPPAWLPTLPGREMPIGTIINGQSTDRISVGTAFATWETSGSVFSSGNWQTTFEFRTDAHHWEQNAHNARFNQQMFPCQVGWRHELSNPRPDTISEWNLPNSSLANLSNNPQPFIFLDVRLKTLDEAVLPNKTWLHNIPYVPYVAATSTAKHSGKGVDAATSFFAHPYSVTFRQVNNIEGVFQSRPFIGASNRPGGQESIVAAPFPLAPLTSLAQLQNLPLLPMDQLNWSGYHYQNLAIGNSFASPALPPDKVRRDSFPFYLGQYFPWDGGDLTGKSYTGTSWFNNDEYTLGHAPARIVDRSYVANQLLFDDYFFSSMAAQKGPVFRPHGAERELSAVVNEFLQGTTPLPLAAYRPYASNAETPSVTTDLLILNGQATADAYRLIAARLLVSGGFNINSTSVEAWTAVLSAAKKKRPVTMPGGTSLEAGDRGNHVISRNPNPALATASEEARWLGYRELSDEQIRELAEAVVRQVKQRGPFRSLGEFVNRRLTSVTSEEDMALHGAIQAALEDPAVSINADYRGAGKEIAAADIAGTNYLFPAAALGSRYQGTPAYINQADILTPIAPIIQARSDTFVVRGYGEARSADGTRILASAWCEAVVQRVPDYLDLTDPAETPPAFLKSQANRQFGRRFNIGSFRWLRSGEI